MSDSSTADQDKALILKPEPHFLINGKVCPVRINRSARAKRMKLKVKATRELVLVLPKRVSLESGLKFAEDEYFWIVEQFKKIETSVPFQHGATFPILGKEHKIVHVPERRGFVWQQDEKLFVTGGVDHIPRRVKDWACREIKKIVIEKSEIYAQQLDVSFRKITIRDQKSRWGSCSSSGNLNFSWRLILMPEQVVNYIVAHEISHLRHMDHSPEFWGKVSYICPEMQAAKTWLKKKGTSLHKYGATF